MQVVKTIEEVREIVKAWRKEEKTIGLVPTMGYLHNGHASLIKKATENDKVVVSIFVNPMQFGPSEDLESYPRDLLRDIRVCEQAGADLIFCPEPDDMYQDGFCSFVDMNGLTKELCGLSRPIHFRGVCTVVSKLLHIVTPDKAYFGEKDAQQLAVIKRMVIDLNMEVQIVGCPIVREEDGLAISSRNTYLNKEERKAALILSRAIEAGKHLVTAGEKNAKNLIYEMKQVILSEPLARIDYVKAVDNQTMQQTETLKSNTLVAIAVYIGNTRLIDNFVIEKGE